FRSRSRYSSELGLGWAHCCVPKRPTSAPPSSLLRARSLPPASRRHPRLQSPHPPPRRLRRATMRPPSFAHPHQSPPGTAMTTMTTTRRRTTASARTRILAWIMLLVTLAAVVIVGATARVMFARVEARANAELAHEADKFRDFAERPDPATGAPYPDVDELLTGHLQHNLPEDNEALFSILDGRPHRRSIAGPPARLDRSEAFIRHAASTDEPEMGTWETSAGPAAYAIMPVEVSG